MDSSTSKSTKVKGFKNLPNEQYNYVVKTLEKYPNLENKDLLYNINEECTIQGFKCTMHIMRKIKTLLNLPAKIK